jgi:hypothetical protein
MIETLGPSMPMIHLKDVAEFVGENLSPIFGGTTGKKDVNERPTEHYPHIV